MMSELYLVVMSLIAVATVFMGLLSILIFSTLIGLRFWYDARQCRRGQRQKEIEAALLVHINHPLRDPRQVLLRCPDDMNLLTTCAAHLLRVTKGTSLLHLQAILQELGVYHWATQQLAAAHHGRLLAAIQLLSFQPTEDTKGHFMDLLHHPHPIIRQTVAEALAQTQDISALPAILRYFQQHNTFSPPLMSSILQKFGPQAAPLLAETIATKNTPLRLKKAALLSLMQTRETAEILAAALPLCQHRSAAVRALAYQAIVATETTLPPDLLLQGAQDVDWRVRQATAAGLAHVRPLSAALLAKLLADDVWLVGLQAGQSLHAAGTAGITLLQTLAKREHLGARRAQAILAEQSGGV